ncbi:MAG: carboxylesterase family protein [Synechococcus sp.]
MRNKSHSHIEIFRNIRYARAERFEQPEVLPWDGVQNTERGPLCPQAPSRLEFVQGPLAPLTMEEHCQVLSVFTPATQGKRPVMVFFHGGAFVSGGGELPWHDGDKLAVEQDVVMVSVTYRLGVFGYFRPSGGPDPSPGMSDQVASLQWIKANIASFGGDADNVTVFGQSAGGCSIETMLAWGHGGELFKRAILQSGTKAFALTRAEVDKTSQQFVAELGHDPKDASVDDLLAAQGRLARKLSPHISWSAVLPETPTGSAVDVIAGWTRDDALVFVLMEKNEKAVPGTEARYLDERREMNSLVWEGGARTLAREITEKGRRACLYRFDWKAPASELGACHCIELPFLLGSQEAWRAAPALAGADWAEIESIGKRMRKIWADFARGGHADTGWSTDVVRVLPDMG